MFILLRVLCEEVSKGPVCLIHGQSAEPSLWVGPIHLSQWVGMSWGLVGSEAFHNIEAFIFSVHLDQNCIFPRCETSKLWGVLLTVLKEPLLSPTPSKFLLLAENGQQLCL